VKKFVFIILFLLLCLSGCSAKDILINKASETEKSAMNEQPEMVVKVYPQEINLNEIPDFIKVTITNLSDTEYRGSWHCGIQYYDGKDWVLANAPAFTDDEIVIEPGGILEINYVPLYPNWSPLLPTDYVHDYIIGEYKVKYDKWYGEFTITG